MLFREVTHEMFVNSFSMRMLYANELEINNTESEVIPMSLRLGTLNDIISAIFS